MREILQKISDIVDAIEENESQERKWQLFYAYYKSDTSIQNSLKEKEKD